VDICWNIVVDLITVPNCLKLSTDSPTACAPCDKAIAETNHNKEVQDEAKKAAEKQKEDALAARKEYLEKANAFDEENTLRAVDTNAINNENAKVAMLSDLENKVSIGQNYVAEQTRLIDEEIQYQIDAEKRKNDAIATSKQNLNNIVQGLEASGLAKTKSGQVIAKAIALTQIGIDSAVAISKASTLANAEGVAAQLAFPLVPGIGTIARVISYASTAASVIGNISRAKQLLSSGGNGGGASASGGGGGGGSISTPASMAPNVNVVGASRTNAIAETIAQQGQQPIKAYVVANDVTTQQGLNRSIVSSASIG